VAATKLNLERLRSPVPSLDILNDEGLLPSKWLDKNSELLELSGLPRSAIWSFFTILKPPQRLFLPAFALPFFLTVFLVAGLA
jgi:hypothetical protein